MWRDSGHSGYGPDFGSIADFVEGVKGAEVRRIREGSPGSKSKAGLRGVRRQARSEPLRFHLRAARQEATTARPMPTKMGRQHYAARSVLTVMPRPVVLLPVGREFAKVTVLIVTLAEPPMVIHVLIGAPNMIIAIERIVDAVASLDVSCTACEYCRRKKRSRQENCRNPFVFQHRR